MTNTDPMREGDIMMYSIHTDCQRTCFSQSATMVMLAMATLVLLLGHPATLLAQPGVVLWNKLGSTTEVQNSEIGTDFEIHSDRLGGAQFVPGQFGQALATTGGTVGTGGG